MIYMLQVITINGKFPGPLINATTNDVVIVNVLNNMNESLLITWWNLTGGAARPNPQGTFNVSNITLAQTFILHGSKGEINGLSRYLVNNVSYLKPQTPLKLADLFANGSGVYQLDQFPTHSMNVECLLSLESTRDG
ncbi:hypothetical protein CQW23_13135 [Capsicum baccatum]|uniref:Plastocyanin-like domain-containing protein n=1 Tax=Capsicum baccatum TaxID=33114 RepID=A0A2G2WUL1_CAPBA|nr:hypothetical protein CQW23_13135 [Capsicum baccatum]